MISLSLQSAEEVQLTLSPVQKLADFGFSMDFSQMIPGVDYAGNISATWAIPSSALSGLDGRRITVKATASADSNSSIFFPSSGPGAKEGTAYLHCDVQGGTCAPSSVLSAEIPFTASVSPGSSATPTITLASEIVESAPAPQEEAANPNVSQAEELFQSISGAFSENSSENQSDILAGLELPNFSNGSGNESFLDSLKPEGDSKDTLGFLKQNPLISLTALVIVIIITGAYLLKSKD